MPTEPLHLLYKQILDNIQELINKLTYIRRVSLPLASCNLDTNIPREVRNHINNTFTRQKIIVSTTRNHLTLALKTLRATNEHILTTEEIAINRRNSNDYEPEQILSIQQATDST
jgi:hypothetical protein